MPTLGDSADEASENAMQADDLKTLLWPSHS
jgi:hypothetical protein